MSDIFLVGKVYSRDLGKIISLGNQNKNKAHFIVNALCFY